MDHDASHGLERHPPFTSRWWLGLAPQCFPLTVNEAVSPLEAKSANRDKALNRQPAQAPDRLGRTGRFKAGGWRYLRSFDIGGSTGCE